MISEEGQPWFYESRIAKISLAGCRRGQAGGISHLSRAEILHLRLLYMVGYCLSVAVCWDVVSATVCE